jgi:sialate O-acetylesterase
MKNVKQLVASIAIVLLSLQQIEAKVTMPYFISDNMVLQQQAKPLIWGWASPNTKITVTTSWNNKKQITESAADGKWSIKLETGAAGGPYTMKIYC